MGAQANSVAPDTLPPDFFAQKNSAPDTLPGDFFEQKAEEKPQGSIWNRIWQHLTVPPQDPHTMTEAQAASGEDPRQTDFVNKIKKAQSVASLGVGWGESPMGMPDTPKIGTVARGVGRDAMAVAGELADRAGSVKDAIGRGVRTPEGKLKPSVRTAARIGGGAVGSIAGTGGTLVGGLSGPTIADAILPDHPNPSGWTAKLPARIPKAATETVRPGPVGISTAPESVSTLPPAALPEIAKGAQGAMTSTGPVPARPLGTPPEVAAKPVDPVAAAIKQGIAAKLPTRMPAPAEPIDPVVAAIKQGIASKIPTRMPKPAAEAAAAAPPSISDISPKASEPRFSGSEGRPATWTNEAVNKLAAKGNRDAISQAIRRGLQLPNNARYIMGDADYPRAVLNPRETTLFSPDGTPIRNAENPLAQNPSSKARIEMPPAPTQPRPGVDFGHPSARPILDQHAPQLRELATRLKGAEPDIAQHLIDIADGKSVGLEQLEGKIRDPEAARQFSRLLDNARREARTARTAALDNQSRGAGSQAERATQAPELDSSKNKIKGKT